MPGGSSKYLKPIETPLLQQFQNLANWSKCTLHHYTMPACRCQGPNPSEWPKMPMAQHLPWTKSCKKSTSDIVWQQCHVAESCYVTDWRLTICSTKSKSCCSQPAESHALPSTKNLGMIGQKKQGISGCKMTQLLLMSLQQQSELGVKWPAPPCFQVAENWCCDQSCPCFHRGRWTCRVLKDSAKSLAVPSGFDAPPLEDYIGPYKKEVPIPITYPETAVYIITFTLLFMIFLKGMLEGHLTVRDVVINRELSANIALQCFYLLAQWLNRERGILWPFRMKFVEWLGSITSIYEQWFMITSRKKLQKKNKCKHIHTQFQHEEMNIVLARDECKPLQKYWKTFSMHGVCHDSVQGSPASFMHQTHSKINCQRSPKTKKASQCLNPWLQSQNDKSQKPNQKAVMAIIISFQKNSMLQETFDTNASDTMAFEVLVLSFLKLPRWLQSQQGKRKVSARTGI